MYVWYLSTLTCFDQFKKQLDACRPDVPEDVYSEFRSVIDGFMRDYLSDFSNRNGTRDIGLLMEPEFDGADRLVNYVGGVDKQRISWESKSDETTYIAEPTKSQTPDASTEKILIGE